MRLVDSERIFPPSNTSGLVVHGVASLALVLVAGWSLWQAAHAVVGPGFILALLPSLLAIGVLPFIIYRGYALMRAYYRLERDGIHLHWGLRTEDIPMDSVLWVRLYSELPWPIPTPRLRWPGAVLGTRHLPDQKARIEYLASDLIRLVVIATPGRWFAISPRDLQGFIKALQRYMEMGSLSPIPARSLYPSFLLVRVWSALAARYLLLAGAILSLALLSWVSLVVPTRDEVYLGYYLFADPVPSIRLLLLPVINGFFFMLDMLLGLYFFRRAEAEPGEMHSAAASPPTGRLLAYLLWGCGVVSPVLFSAAVYFILLQ